MDVDVRRLSPALIADYLGFFDDVAFEDHREWAGCYCTHFHWDAALETEHRLSGSHKCGRDYAVEFLLSGVIQGYLAYADGKAVGWCNANDRAGYRRLAEWPELWADAVRSDRVKAVVCFVIAPGMRGKGIATQLLNRVCEDAAAEGYDYVEAYPLRGETDAYRNHHGPYALYEKCGFSLHATLDDDLVVRRYC